jgi:uncharacterized protein YjiS (DUF1127 family)
MNAVVLEEPHYVPISSIHRPGRYKKDKDYQMFTNLVRLFQSWKRYNKSLNELNRLGDRELADIGLSRSDIPRVAWGASHRS